MDKIVVCTKFNKTGKRILTTPLQEKQVCAPANRRYRQSYYSIESEFKKKKDEPLYRYIEEMSHFIASYVASSSATHEQRYKITKFLAEGSLRETGPIAIGGRMDSARWSRQLIDILGLSQAEEKLWETYVKESNELWEWRKEALKKASNEHDAMKRALWREVSNQIHRKFHPQNDKALK